MSDHARWFFFGLIVGVAVSASWFLGIPAVPALTNGSPLVPTTESNSIKTIESGAVSVHDQVAGSVVTIESVTVPPPGVWVAVREVSGNTVGNILGAGHARGPVSNFSVPLLRATVSGRTYFVTLYRDDGDDLFDASKDSAYVDFDTGERVTASFKTLP